MICNDVKSNHHGEAQQLLPQPAESAREKRPDDAGEEVGEVTWVGEQRLFQGYCGRALVTGRALVPKGSNEGERPVVLLHRPRRRVVRIGPRPSDGPAAKAA